MNEIAEAVDSIQCYADSVGRSIYKEAMQTTYRTTTLPKKDSTEVAKQPAAYINTDSIFNAMTSTEKLNTLTTTGNRMNSLASEWSMKSYLTKDADSNVRSHLSDWHKK